MNLNLNKKNKELLMYCALAFVAGYLMCMYYPLHSSTNGGYSFGLFEGNAHNASPNNRRGSNNHSGEGEGEGEGEERR